VIKYRSGFKYQLAEEYRVQTPIRGKTISEPFIRLIVTGELTILRGYAWDGPSGPAIDTKNFMRGSLVHDALYQLMRIGRLDPKIHREPADQLLRQMCREDGMSWIRAWWVYKSVHYFGSPAADSHNKKEILEAP
jgi:hypothetical protein